MAGDGKKPTTLDEAAAARQTRKLWADYKTTGDQQLRDQLILLYLPLVNYVANNLHRRLPEHIEKDDLLGNGMVGLIMAVERFDPNEGTKFETYAQNRIRGAMIDNMRELDHVPRSLRTRQRKIDQAVARQMQTSGTGEIQWDQIASSLEMTRPELDETLADIARANTYSLDEFFAASSDDDEASAYDRITDENSPNPVAETEREERYQALVRAIDGLPERERLVLVLFYYEEQPLKEISKILGVTESRISQLQGQALVRLRARLQHLLRP